MQELDDSFCYLTLQPQSILEGINVNNLKALCLSIYML